MSRNDPSHAPSFHDGISEIADRYDGYVLDLWGVLHDGVKAYPGVADCLRRLKALGKRVCLLSNAPRRVASSEARLVGMGLTPDLWDALMTSGEASHEALRDRPDPWHAALGTRFLHLGPDRDRDVFDSLPGLVQVAAPDQAEFVVNTGIDDFDETLADHEPVLAACAARRLPMLCANPDLVVHVGEKLVICAGELARRYEELGGDVRYHGKPHAPVYRRCFDLLGGIPPERVLAVGDSLRTDVAGANAAGIDSLLVTGGIHREELGVASGGHPEPAVLAALLDASGQRPTGLIHRLAW